MTEMQHPSSHLAADLYTAITRQSRQIIFYQAYHVPDTPQGRFEMLALHLAVLLRRLKAFPAKKGEDWQELVQSLCDWVVADMEESLRVMRIKESKISSCLKGLVEGFYGRLVAYDKALALKDGPMLEQAIRRNVYGIVDRVSDDCVENLVSYVLQLQDALEKTSLPQLLAGLTGDVLQHAPRAHP